MNNLPYEDDPRLDAWKAFRDGERVRGDRHICTECHEPIPKEDDVIKWVDGSGRICEKCAAS